MDDADLIGEAILEGEPEETVDGLPVLAEVRPVEAVGAPAPAALATRQVAAVAASGFVAGAATVALVRLHAQRKQARVQRSVPRRAIDMLPVVGSRTFLVDVHLLAKPGE